ncbi:MAG: pyruvate kinase [Acidobacteria bacterium]|nr:pyruvate kinase [Acidobacteriota bacterium]
MRHTKIVATLGPATKDDATLDALLRAGVDVVRLNFSHGTHDTHHLTYARARAAAERVGRQVAIMQDLSGPKIRTGRLEGGQPIQLHEGDALVVATGDFTGGPGRVSTTYAELARTVNAGDRLLLDDGRIELRVDGSDGVEIRTRVVNGGWLAEHKGINAPQVALPTGALTDKDEEDLKFGLSLGVDLVALSFVQSAGDLTSARALATAFGVPDIPLVAKLERPEAIARLDEILDHADAVMVARGDLGLEVPFERVPRVQKDILRTANARGVPAIVATQVLESMREEPRPTRAEVSDAAGAVDMGAGAIMLAGETAAGKHPVKAVEALAAIIRDAESDGVRRPVSVPRLPGEGPWDHASGLADAAIGLAARAHAGAIVAVTREGRTARMLSSGRPTAPIYAATDRPEIARRLALWWGVVPLVVPLDGSVDDVGGRVVDELRAMGALNASPTVVIVNVSPDLDLGAANFVRIRRA